MKTRDVSFTASMQYNIYNIHRGDAAAGLHLHNNVPGPDLYLLRALCQAYCNEHSLSTSLRSQYIILVSSDSYVIRGLRGHPPTGKLKGAAYRLAWPT